MESSLLSTDVRCSSSVALPEYKSPTLSESTSDQHTPKEMPSTSREIKRKQNVQDEEFINSILEEKVSHFLVLVR